MVLVTMEIPQLRLDMVVDGPLVAVVQFPVVTPRLDPHGPDCLSDHRDSPVASHGVQCPVVQGVLVVDIPVVVQRPIPMVLPVLEDHGDSAVQYFSWWSMPLLCGSCEFPVLLSRRQHDVARSCW